jgi:phosphoribosylformylglycinamidine cyclo-ligase
MPGTYHANEYDLVGIATGIIEKEKVVDGSRVEDGDIAIGVHSSGLHTNGYSLARKLIFDSLNLSVDDFLPGYDVTVGSCLLTPHMNYSTLVQSFMNNNVNIKSLAHITGGGLIDNVPRVLPNNLSLDININSWKKLPIFEFLSNALDIEKEDLYQTFNMGIGLVIVVSPEEKGEVFRCLGAKNYTEIGVVIKDESNSVFLNEK